MKVSRVFVVVIIALMAVMILFEINAPSRFQWYDDSQSYKSKQPFGCYVMDSVLRASLPQGYEVLGDDIEQYFDKKSKKGQHTFLFTNNYDDFNRLYDVDLLKWIKEGNNIVLAENDNYRYRGYYNPDVKDIGEELEFSFQSVDNIYTNHFDKETLCDRTLYDTILWRADDKFATATYLISTAFCDEELKLSSSFRTLAILHKVKKPYDGDDDGVYYKSYAPEEGYSASVAAIRDYGKGKVVVVSMPMLFSNYGILNDTIRPFVLRLLSECGNLPVVRYDPTYISRTSNNQESESPLRYLLANRPLKWALYLALATLVAFVVFSARRRQRVIPVIKPPVNHMMDFVKRIGGIYYKKHDNVDLLNKKYATFCNDLRTKAMIDIEGSEYLDDELLSLSNRTDIPFNQLQQQISDVKNAVNASWISDKQLQQLIDTMNDIMHRINI